MRLANSRTNINLRADRALRDAERLADSRLRRSGNEPRDLMICSSVNWLFLGIFPPYPGRTHALTGPTSGGQVRAPHPALRTAPTRVTPRTHHHDQYLTRDVDAEVFYDDALDAHQNPGYLAVSRTVWLPVYVAQTRV